jgi:hypothetical protein
MTHTIRRILMNVFQREVDNSSNEFAIDEPERFLKGEVPD